MNGYNGGGISTEVIEANNSGYVEATNWSSSCVNFMFGLNDNNTTYSYTDINYAFYIFCNKIYILENGSHASGSAVIYGYVTAQTDKLKAERESDGTVKYYHNDTLLYTSGTTNTGELFADVCLYNNGLSIDGSIYNEVAGEELWQYVGTSDDIYYDLGKVGIGTQDLPGTGFNLYVADGILAEGVVIKNEINWPDYVFDNNYKLQTLDFVEEHIEQYGHLPRIPSKQAIEIEGVNIGKMNVLLLEKIEELTLYVLSQYKKQRELEHLLNELKENQTDGK
jgi:hypothetical protein